MNSNPRHSFESLCKSLAPELTPLPVYVLFESEIPTVGQPGYGFTHPDLDWLMKPDIRDWRGRGPTIFINDVAIAADHQDPDAAIRSTLIHELAHVVCFGGGAYRRYAAESPPLPPLMMLRPREPAAHQANEFAHHDARFIRAALHLFTRAEADGHAVGIELGMRSDWYALSDPTCYLLRLAPELEDPRFRTMPFAEIFRRPPPERFRQLWRADRAARKLIMKGIAMSQPNAVDAVIDAARKLKEESQSAYAELVGRLADGAEVSPEDLIAAADTAGKSLEDVRVDVAAIEARRGLQAELAGIPEKRNQAKALQSRIATSAMELEAAQARHAAVLRSLSPELEALKAETVRESTLRRELAKSAPAALQRKLEENDRAVKALEAQKADVGKHIAIIETWLGQKHWTAEQKDGYRGRLEKHQAELAQLEEWMADWIKKRDALQRELIAA